MKLSGHSYNNDVFQSLLDGISKDVVLTKTASKQDRAPITGMDIFSSTTEETLRSIQDDRLRAIAAELQFAADRSKVAVNTNDLAKFAEKVVRENIRGKELERAAQRFCSDLDRDIAPPQGVTRRGESHTIHGIASATYDPESINDGGRVTGGFLGCSKNPNSIFDSEALQRFASVKHGDEQIKESKEAQKAFAHDQKKAMWEELQNKLSDPNLTQKGIKNAGTYSQSEPVVNQKLPANSMSIFSENRDFENIPVETDGERIAKLAEARAQKVAAAKAEWDKSEPAKKLDNTGFVGKIFNKD
jgi:hypothetical protein